MENVFRNVINHIRQKMVPAAQEPAAETLVHRTHPRTHISALTSREVLKKQKRGQNLAYSSCVMSFSALWLRQKT
jgi:hypothetical protein